MALIKCPECSKEVSSSALACPGCGHPIAPAGAVELPKPKTRQPNETLGLFLVIIPIAASALAWFWITELRLIDNSGGKLAFIMAGTIVLTAILAAIESAQLGIGSDADIAAWKSRNQNHTGRMKPPSPFAWFFCLVMLWLFTYPTYLYYRSKYGAKNLIGAGLLSALVFIGVTTFVYIGIDAANQDFNKQVEKSQKELAPLFR